MYFVVSVEAETDEAAIDTVSTWLSELPPEYSGVRLGFHGMTFSTTPLQDEDAWAIDARTSHWYRNSEGVA